MKHFALALAALILATHYGYMPLADERAQQWAFYVMQGVHGAALLGLALYAVLAWARPGMWRNAAAGVCAAGIFEQVMVSFCGMAAYLRPVSPTPWQGLCGAQIGAPVAAIALGIAAAACAAVLAPDRRGKDGA